MSSPGEGGGAGAAVIALNHCLHRLSAGAGAAAPCGSNVMRGTTQASAWIWTVCAHVYKQTAARTKRSALVQRARRWEDAHILSRGSSIRKRSSTAGADQMMRAGSTQVCILFFYPPIQLFGDCLGVETEPQIALMVCHRCNNVCEWIKLLLEQMDHAG